MPATAKAFSLARRQKSQTGAGPTKGKRELCGANVEAVWATPMVAMWPTPTSRDHKDGRLRSERSNEWSAWADSVWPGSGADGKARRVEPGIRLLAHGVPARVGKLRAYGNAIVPQVAAEVIGAYLDAEGARPVRLEPSLFD
jgi:hypothetical protein